MWTLQCKCGFRNNFYLVKFIEHFYFNLEFPIINKLQFNSFLRNLTIYFLSDIVRVWQGKRNFQFICSKLFGVSWGYIVGIQFIYFI